MRHYTRVVVKRNMLMFHYYRVHDTDSPPPTPDAVTWVRPKGKTDNQQPGKRVSASVNSRSFTLKLNWYSCPMYKREASYPSGEKTLLRKSQTI